MNATRTRIDRPAARATEPMDYVARRLISLVVLVSAAVTLVGALVADASGLSPDGTKAVALVLFLATISVGATIGSALDRRRRIGRGADADARLSAGPRP